MFLYRGRIPASELFAWAAGSLLLIWAPVYLLGVWALLKVSPSYPTFIGWMVIGAASMGLTRKNPAVLFRLPSFALSLLALSLLLLLLQLTLYANLALAWKRAIAVLAMFAFGVLYWLKPGIRSYAGCGVWFAPVWYFTCLLVAEKLPSPWLRIPALALWVALGVWLCLVLTRIWLGSLERDAEREMARAGWTSSGWQKVGSDYLGRYPGLAALGEWADKMALAGDVEQARSVYLRILLSFIKSGLIDPFVLSKAYLGLLVCAARQGRGEELRELLSGSHLKPPFSHLVDGCLKQLEEKGLSQADSDLYARLKAGGLATNLVLSRWDVRQSGLGRSPVAWLGGDRGAVIACVVEGSQAAPASQPMPLDDLPSLPAVRYGRPVATLKADGLSIERLLYSPDGTFLATWSDRNAAGLWKGDQLLASFEKCSLVGFSPDSRSLYLTDGSALNRVDTRTLEVESRPCTLDGRVLSPDGRWMAGFGPDGHGPWLFDLHDGSARELQSAGRAYRSRYCLAFSSDSARLAMTAGPVVGIWSVKTGELLLTTPPVNRDVTGAVFVPVADERLLVLSTMGGSVFVVDLNQKALVSQMLAHSELRAIALSPDGRKVAVGRVDPEPGCHVFDLDSGELWGILTQKYDDIWSVAFRPDGEEIATGDQSGKVVLYQGWEERVLL